VANQPNSLIVLEKELAANIWGPVYMTYERAGEDPATNEYPFVKYDKMNWIAVGLVGIGTVISAKA